MASRIRSSARRSSQSMRALQLVEKLGDPGETCFELFHIVAVADAHVGVPLEVVTGNDEDALLVANPLEELGGVDGPVVADEGDRSRFRANPGEVARVPRHKGREDGKLLVQDSSRALENEVAPSRLKGYRRQPVG